MGPDMGACFEEWAPIGVLNGFEIRGRQYGPRARTVKKNELSEKNQGGLACSQQHSLLS